MPLIWNGSSGNRSDFIIGEYTYVNANLDDFTWEGVDVYVIGELGEKSKWGYSCGMMEAALKRKDELLMQYKKIIIRDNDCQWVTRLLFVEGIAYVVKIENYPGKC